MSEPFTFSWKCGTVSVLIDEAGMSSGVVNAVTYRGQVGERYRDFDTMQKAKRWVTEKGRIPTRWATLEPQHNPNNPQLDFYGANDTWLYSSWDYKNPRHAWAWLDRRRVSNIPVVAIRLGKQSK